ncbi:MAG: class II aldolase/adducin family protein [Pseudomonadota bacterium]
MTTLDSPSHRNNNNSIKSDLAAAYRIISHLGLDDHTYTHLSSRSEEKDSYYIYPFGLLFSEVAPKNLLKVSLDGKILEGAEYQYNKTGYVIHSLIYSKRSDINSVFHLHTPASVAVSAMRAGLLPISQWALHFYGKISYHEYNSLALDLESHEERLVKDLGKNYTMLMRNHGSITSGRTIQEAMFYTHHLEQACKAQCLAYGMGQELVIPPPEVCEKAVKDLLGFEENLGMRDWLAWIRLLGK